MNAFYLLIALSEHVNLELKSFSVSKSMDFGKMPWECVPVFVEASTFVCMQKPKKTVEWCFPSFPPYSFKPWSLSELCKIFHTFVLFCLSESKAQKTK